MRTTLNWPATHGRLETLLASRPKELYGCVILLDSFRKKRKNVSGIIVLLRWCTYLLLGQSRNGVGIDARVGIGISVVTPQPQQQFHGIGMVLLSAGAKRKRPRPLLLLRLRR